MDVATWQAPHPPPPQNKSRTWQEKQQHQ